MFPAPLTIPTRAPRALWLIRHGESTWNQRGLCQGQRPGPRLTSRGRHQADRCAERLIGEPIGLLVSSDLERALETAAPIGRALGLVPLPDRRLRERALGAAEGEPIASLGTDRSGVAGGRVVDADAAPEGGESVRQLYDRVTACVAEHLGRGDGELALVCHGGVVRVLLAWLSGTGPEAMGWPEVPNAAPARRIATAPAGQDQSAPDHEQEEHR